jgi:hypothetical protein
MVEALINPVQAFVHTYFLAELTATACIAHIGGQAA